MLCFNGAIYPHGVECDLSNRVAPVYRLNPLMEPVRASERV